jgi:hypothetical protein
MSAPVLFDGSPFSEYLAEVLGEEEGAGIDITDAPDDASLLAALAGPEPPAARHATALAEVAAEGAAGGWHGGRWLSGVLGEVLGWEAERALLLERHAARCEVLAGGNPAALPPSSETRVNHGADCCVGSPRWMGTCVLAVLAAAAAAVVGPSMLRVDAVAAARALGSADGGVSAWTVWAAKAAGWGLVGAATTVGGGWLAASCSAVRLQPALDMQTALMGRCASAGTELERSCRQAVRTVQEVELMSRGYHIIPSANGAQPRARVWPLGGCGRR